MEDFLYQVLQGLRTFFWFKGFSIFWEFLICIIVGNSGSMSSTPVVSGNHSVALCQCKRYKKCGFYLWVGKILWRRASKPTPLFLPGESHGQRRLGAVFEDNDLLFWMPDVLCQHSEVVLWSLLSVEIFFWGICEGESGLPVLFLRHLRTAPYKLLRKELRRGSQKSQRKFKLGWCSGSQVKKVFWAQEWWTIPDAANRARQMNIKN